MSAMSNFLQTTNRNTAWHCWTGAETSQKTGQADQIFILLLL